MIDRLTIRLWEPVQAFAAINSAWHKIKPLMLPEPKANPERVAREMAKLAPLRSAPEHNHKAWMDRLEAKIASGQRVSLFARACLMRGRGIMA